MNQLLSLVKDLVDLKSIKESCLIPNKILFNPVHVLNFVENVLKYQAEAKHLEVSYKTVDPSVLTDPLHSVQNFNRLK